RRAAGDPRALPNKAETGGRHVSQSGSLCWMVRKWSQLRPSSGGPCGLFGVAFLHASAPLPFELGSTKLNRKEVGAGQMRVGFLNLPVEAGKIIGTVTLGIRAELVRGLPTDRQHSARCAVACCRPFQEGIVADCECLGNLLRRDLIYQDISPSLRRG